MNEREQFHSQVKQILKPALIADGFRATGTTYHRKLGDVIHVITIQGSVYGGRCCVCLGIHLTFLPTMGSSSVCDPAKISEPECEFRLRLTPHGQADCWWSYGVAVQEARASVEAILHLYREVAVPYFGRFSSFPADFIRVAPSMLANDTPLQFPGHSTIVRHALALSRIALHTGRTADAKQFAEIGLAHVGHAITLKNELQKIISIE